MRSLCWGRTRHFGGESLPSAIHSQSNCNSGPFAGPLRNPLSRPVLNNVSCSYLVSPPVSPTNEPRQPWTPIATPTLRDGPCPPNGPLCDLWTSVASSPTRALQRPGLRLQIALLLLLALLLANTLLALLVAPAFKVMAGQCPWPRSTAMLPPADPIASRCNSLYSLRRANSLLIDQHPLLARIPIPCYTTRAMDLQIRIS